MIKGRDLLILYISLSLSSQSPKSIVDIFELLLFIYIACVIIF